MKRNALRVLLTGLLVAVVGVAPGTARPSLAEGDAYEVWTIDQADAARGGARLYIYPQSAIEAGAGEPEVVDLQAAATGVGDGPGVRPHLLLFNTRQTHGIVANVTSGHVYFMRARDRTVVASIDVGEQAHGAVASPDDSIVLVANQNGKKLARIRTDFAAETFTYDPAHDLNLAALEDAEHPDNAPICPLLFVGGGKKAYVTLRGGGLYVVDAGSTPMQVVKSFGRSEVAPAGCGGVALGNKIYVNSGLPNSSDLYVFDGRSDLLVKHVSVSPIGADAHGMVLTGGGRYLWMGNRASANAAVVATASDTIVATLPDLGKAPDIMDITPGGTHVVYPLRGPNNLTGGPPAKGETPGLAVLRVVDGGARGVRSAFFPIGDQSADSPNDPHGVAVRRITPGLNVSATARVDNGAFTYSASLANGTAIAAANLYVALPVPAGVTSVRATATPRGAGFRGIEGDAAVWLLDRVPQGSTVGPFSYTGAVVGATPQPGGAFVHWTAPLDGVATSAPPAPTVAGLPPGTVRISGVVPGMGEHWANPRDLPLGPIYGVYGGKIVFLEYMISQADFARGVDHRELLGNKGLPPIDHIDLEFQPQGHDGYPIPHFDIHAYMVSHEEHGAIPP